MISAELNVFPLGFNKVNTQHCTYIGCGREGSATIDLFFKDRIQSFDCVASYCTCWLFIFTTLQSTDILHSCVVHISSRLYICMIY